MARNKIPGVKQEKVPAQLWKRAFAYVIDAFIIALIIGLPFSPLLDVDTDNSFSSLFKLKARDYGPKFFLITLITALLAILYWAVFEYKFTQSIGKLALRINVDTTQKGKLTFSQCFMRNISKMSTFLLVLDCIYMIATKSNQRYLEKLSNTKVVETGWAL